MGGHGAKTGAHKRLAELGAHIDVSAAFLLSLRSVAYAWPRQLRVSEAPWFVHRAYLDGGPSKADHRRAQLLALERDRWGRITTGIFERWRKAQKRQPVPVRPTHREHELAPALDALACKIDRILRAGAPEALWAPVRHHLDALAADVERILAEAA
jgi:hypothetical protein